MNPTTRQDGLLSPALSEVTINYIASDSLPTPRSHSIPPGSSKETALINYTDAKLLNITRRYAKSFAAEKSDRGQEAGYVTFDQVISDIDPVLDVIWISATPSIQIPYILALAGHFRGFMHSFAFSTNAFTLARRFDLAFSTLLKEASNASEASAINNTDKVRISSLAQETRVEMINIASSSGHSMNVRSTRNGNDHHTIDDNEFDDSDEDDETEYGEDAAVPSIAASLGKVYEKTLEILGGELGSYSPSTRPMQPTRSQTPDDVEIIDL